MGVLGDPFGTGTTSFNVSNLSPDFAKNLSKDLSGAGASWWQYLKNNDPAQYEFNRNHELNRVANAAKLAGWSAGSVGLTDAEKSSLASNIQSLQDMGLSAEDAKNYVSNAFSSAYQQYVSNQAKVSQSSFSAALPSVLAVGSLFVPVAGAIGSALTQTAATTLASQVVGSAVVQGLLAESQGGNFADGAIKGAISAGVAPAVAQTVGSSVANLMGDSAVKNVVANAVSSAATGAVTAALTGGDVEQAAKTGALAGAGGATGRELGTAAELGTTPFSEQTQQLAAQTQGFGTPADFGASLGSQLAQGKDPEQAILSALATAQGQKSAATGREVTTPAAQQVTEAPVTVPGAENVAQLVSTPGGEIVAGPAGLTTNYVAAMPQMQPRANEQAGDVVAKPYDETDPATGRRFVGTEYSRRITGVTPGGKQYGYTVIYDPDFTGKEVRYEYNTQLSQGSEGVLPEIGITSSSSRPDFSEEEVGGFAKTKPEESVKQASTVTQEPVNILDLIAQQQAAVTPTAPVTQEQAVDVAAVKPSTVDETGPSFVGPIAAQITGPVALVPDQQLLDFTNLFDKAVPKNVESADLTSLLGLGTPTKTDQIDTSTVLDTGGTTVTPTGLPSTQQKTIPDQITQDLTGGTGGLIVPGETGGPGGPGTDVITVGPGTDTVITGPGPGEGPGQGPGTDTDTTTIIDTEGPVTTVEPSEPTIRVDETVPEVVDITAPPPEVVEEEPVDKVIVDPEEEVVTEETQRPTILERPYISGGRRPTMKPTVTTLGQALSPAFFPSGPVSGLTSYRGAGEIESSKTGKPRQNVWNEASLRLKDALGL